MLRRGALAASFLVPVAFVTTALAAGTDARGADSDRSTSRARLEARIVRLEERLAAAPTVSRRSAPMAAREVGARVARRYAQTARRLLEVGNDRGAGVLVERAEHLLPEAPPSDAPAASPEPAVQP
jgi:hypothetical protein